jgi:Fibronectin type III domain
VSSSITAQVAVGTGGLLKIKIEQVSQDSTTLTSKVKVTGTITNTSAGRITGASTDGRISGDQTFLQGNWTYNLASAAAMDFVSHTFTVQHNDRGNLSVTFNVSFAFTGDPVLGNSGFVQATCVLDRIKTAPTPPQNPVVSNQTPTKVTISWDAPADNGGSSVTGYYLVRYTGDSTIGTGKKYSTSSSRSRNFTDLTPNQDYTYLIYAVNNTQFNKGVSAASDPANVFSISGVFVRHGGIWVKGDPYIRVAGKWVPAQISVRSSGSWQPTNP